MQGRTNMDQLRTRILGPPLEDHTQCRCESPCLDWEKPIGKTMWLMTFRYPISTSASHEGKRKLQLACTIATIMQTKISHLDLLVPLGRRWLQDRLHSPCRFRAS